MGESKKNTRAVGSTHTDTRVVEKKQGHQGLWGIHNRPQKDTEVHQGTLERHRGTPEPWGSHRGAQGDTRRTHTDTKAVGPTQRGIRGFGGLIGTAGAVGNTQRDIRAVGDTEGHLVLLGNHRGTPGVTGRH